MPFAEKYAFPIDARIGTSIPRTNDFKELFYVRWGNIWFNVFWGHDLNIKVVLNVYRSDGVCERFIVDTDPHEVQWDRHKRVTITVRDRAYLAWPDDVLAVWQPRKLGNG